MMKKFWTRLAVLVLLLGINYGADQYSKQWAREALAEDARYSYFNDLAHLQLAENHGAFLSAGSNLKGGWHLVFLKILPLLVLVGMIIYLLASNSFSTGQFISLACVLGGGLGNVLDRIQFGSVTDFMILSYGDIHTGIFNVADLSLT